jgi:chitosanase
MSITLSEANLRTIEAIVGVFEVGRIGGPEAYSTVTLLKGDTGGLTYGKHQTTLNSGNLYLLIKAYIEDADADFKSEFVPYMGRLLNRDSELNTDAAFRALLTKAGKDRDMQQTQDEFFRRVYMAPAVRAGQAMEFRRIVSYAVVYDSFIHGSYKYIKGLTDASVGTADNAGESTWIKQYNELRRDWLANHDNPLLRKTIYRQDAFRVIFGGDNWDLVLPITVRGVKITAQALGLESGDFTTGSASIVRASASDEPNRLLMLVEPYMQGADVRAVKAALNKHGYPVSDNDEYDPITVEAVRLFQGRNLLRSDGVIGPASRSALGIA